MPSHVCPSGYKKLIAGTLATAAIVLGAPAAADATTSAKTFQPVGQSSHSATFRPAASTESVQVDAAQALLKKSGRRVARPVSVAAVRQAIESAGTVTVRKPAGSRAIALRVELDEQSSPGSETQPTTPTSTPTSTATPTTTPGATTSPAPTTGPPPQAPDATPSGSCAVDPQTLTGVGCNVLRTDTSEIADPTAGLWGSIDCADSSRYQFVQSGGDTAPTASGATQGNDAFRALTAIDGDDIYGERCELGHNSSRYGINRGSQTNGTFALYKEGEQRVTFLSERYPDNFSTTIQSWQTVVQMKQAQPADNGGGGPILELQIYGGKLHLFNRWHEVWNTPAPASDKWIRYALDTTYSPDPATGSIKVYVDLNGDGDALDAGEQSPVLHIATMLSETDGPNGTSDGYAPGDTIPDHLRVGIYHNPSIACPPPSGCSVDLDNVQVTG